MILWWVGGLLRRQNVDMRKNIAIFTGFSSMLSAQYSHPNETTGKTCSTKYVYTHVAQQDAVRYTLLSSVSTFLFSLFSVLTGDSSVIEQ